MCPRNFASGANIFFKNNFPFLDTDEPAKNGITGPKSFRGFRETGPQRAYNANRFIVIILRLLPRGIYVMQALKLQAVTHMSNLVVVFFYFLDPGSLTSAVIFLPLSVLTAVLNALVIMTIWKDPFKNLKGITHYLMLNLAVSDLLIGIPAELLLVPLYWHHSESVEQAAKITQHLGFCASGLTILGLAAERLIVISYPFKSANYLTYTNLARGILCIWILAGLDGIISVFKWASTKKNSIIIADSVGIPVLTLTVACYSRILFLVRKGSHRDLTNEAGCDERQRLTENAREREKITERERRVVRCVAILVGLLILCWTPYLVVENIAQFCGKKCVVPDALKSIVYGLVYLHPVVNPIAYSLCSRKFRLALWKIIYKTVQHCATNMRHYLK